MADRNEHLIFEFRQPIDALISINTFSLSFPPSSRISSPFQTAKGIGDGVLVTRWTLSRGAYSHPILSSESKGRQVLTGFSLPFASVRVLQHI